MTLIQRAIYWIDFIPMFIYYYGWFIIITDDFFQEDWTYFTFTPQLWTTVLEFQLFKNPYLEGKWSHDLLGINVVNLLDDWGKKIMCGINEMENICHVAFVEKCQKSTKYFLFFFLSFFSFCSLLALIFLDFENENMIIKNPHHYNNQN